MLSRWWIIGCLSVANSWKKAQRFKIQSSACLWGNQIGSIVGNETDNVNWDYIIKRFQCQAKGLGCCCVLYSVAQLCPTLCDPMDCSPPGSSVHGILQARILEWIFVPFSRGSSWCSDWTWISSLTGRFFTLWTTWLPYWTAQIESIFIIAENSVDPAGN